MRKSRVKNGFFKKLITFMSVSALAAVLAVPAFAGLTDIDLDRTGSISVTIKTNDTNAPIEGGTLSLYRVAYTTLGEDDYIYRYTSDFEGCDESLCSEEKIGLASTAGLFSAWVEEKEVGPIIEAEVGPGGTTVFSGLSCGLYLVKQLTPADKYQPVSAFLVSIPIEEDGEALYEVDAAPKTGTAERDTGRVEISDGGDGGNIQNDGGGSEVEGGGSHQTGDVRLLPSLVAGAGALFATVVLLGRRRKV